MVQSGTGAQDMEEGRVWGGGGREGMHKGKQAESGNCVNKLRLHQPTFVRGHKEQAGVAGILTVQ